MKSSIIYIFLLIFTFSIVDDAKAQLSLGLGGSSYYFVNSRDNNPHFGGELRFARDWDLYMVEADVSYYAPVISSIPTKGYEVNPSTNFPLQINIINSVDAYTIVSDVNFMYFFKGKPIAENGFYSITGAGLFYYDQTYNLSHFIETDYYSEEFIDEANYSSTQLIFNIGIGGKVPMRKSSWYYEAKFSFLTDPYKDYDRAVQSSHFITIATGIRFHIKTRKSRFQRIALGRTSKQKKKSKKRIRD